MGKANGITPQGDYETRRKFFIVLGFDDEGNVYGGVVVNSRLNSRLPSVGQALFGKWGSTMAGMALIPSILGAVIVVAVVSFFFGKRE